jgi:hypothetical protein
MLAVLGIKCSGLWCRNGQFTCGPGNLDCWQMEHIIDLNGSPAVGCDLNIVGNVVMAYGRWNNEIGRLSWRDVRHEKTLVYKQIFELAVENVLKCGCNITDNTQLDYYLIRAGLHGSELESFILIIILAASIVIFMTTACILACLRGCTKRIDGYTPLDTSDTISDSFEDVLYA